MAEGDGIYFSLGGDALLQPGFFFHSSLLIIQKIMIIIHHQCY